ncbi:MAG: 3-hydroxyacyl-CoA dehydrogenase NAD-binding domain-containing protein [Pirellulaceae bacterium]|jgi:3-hydroxyacyl-CoA dehydrogenase/enoyl-CoA hydratase/3-hydroxybutyryl-CoA epimerase/3-hydroxyacyl-CoA dehydrogenase/enoyl-CoA hydratase/3-hydroxybutyryl-CoA epimerase/enoyl-CoA isomerase|nr:multifunctional fatty acid oxidation complex subunit alpha [Planctomycetaceae bacterium]MDP6556640.1 3-hydroxyacyl-CoA dehydrogenase NAD-binding domain-containing protein [Pirellulaceae bacterium]
MPGAQTLTLSMPEPDVALLTFDTPDKGANVLSTSVLEELSMHLDALDGRDDIAGLIICSGKPGMFIAGADLREFVASLDVEKDQIVQMCRRGQTLFGRLAKSNFVTIAAIDGICVGGGAELAIWCDRRLMSSGPKTEFGFPEVKLGLFPGWGGTARAPRITGLGNAVEMITGGESVNAKTARLMNLVSDVVAPDQLIPAAIAMIRHEQTSGDYKQDRQCWSRPLPISETELGFLGATASAVIRGQTKGQYPAPEAALEVMLEAASTDVETACQMEAEGMAQLFGSSVNASLLNVFFLTDRNKKDSGVDSLSDAGLKPATVSSVGVVGAGIMGAGIAAANIRRGVSVVIDDASKETLRESAQSILEEAAYDRELKGPDGHRVAELAPSLDLCMVDQEFADCDVFIEAVVENLDVKRQVFARIEPHLRDTAILASNTSTIPITTMAENVRHPERFCGIHFFNPVRRMKLVEIIRGEKTSDETVTTAVAYTKRIGKMPIVLNDGPGFLVNRLLFPYMSEALALLSEGARIKDIDRAAKAFGMPMGPIELYDLVGIDTATFAGQTMSDAFPERIVSSPILPAMVKAGRLGKKSGLGFFSYKNKRKRAAPDPGLDAFLSEYIASDRAFARDELTDRLFMPMLLEATRALEDNIVRDPRDIDLGLIFGLGFPPFKGGLMFWADHVGAVALVEKLKPLESVGVRMQPTQTLLEMAQSGKTFYPE